MRLEVVSPDNETRVSLMAESAVTASGDLKECSYYVGMFADAVRQRPHHSRAVLAKRAVNAVMKNKFEFSVKVKVLESLMLFAYLCGWHTADSYFQQKLIKVQVEA